MGEVFFNFCDDLELCVVIIIGGGEKFFFVGWDLKVVVEGEVLDVDFGFGGFVGLIEIFDFDKLVIVVVNGYVFGGGFELVLVVDFIVCVENVSFVLLEVKFGIVFDSGGVLCLFKLLLLVIVNEMVMIGR